MKKKSLIFSMFIIVPIVMLLVLYFSLAFYYRDGFSCGTWINGIYCTGKSIEEVNQELLADLKVPGMVLTDRYGNQSVLDLNQIAYTADYTNQLVLLSSRQNPFLWFQNLFTGFNREMTPDISFDEEMLAQKLQELPIVKDEAERPHTVEIVWTEEGYVLQNGMENVLNTESLLQAVKQGIADGSETLFLEEAGCYEDLKLTPVMKQTLLLWDKVQRFQRCYVVYDFETDTVPVTLKDSSLFILTDENGKIVTDEVGNLLVDEEAVAEYISGLAAQYDTYGKVREFTATCGETVYIEGGTYGSQLNQKAETEYLIQAFLEQRTEVRTPEYKKGEKFGRGEIGDTYIEVDLTDQKLYYYEQGELLFETDVVTGNMKKGHDTPAGVNFVYAKQRNRTLRGADYESFVQYWMPVAGNIGIHDASWRSKFGGNIYMTNGSHGCINVPRSKMKDLYDMIKIGTPVVMFYHEEP